MITVVAKSNIRLETKQQYIKIANELIKETRKEKGNISYRLYEDVSNHNIMTFIEQWEDKESLDIHMNSNHFKKLVPKLNELREGKSEVNTYSMIAK